jgi:BON domain-containing protein
MFFCRKERMKMRIFQTRSNDGKAAALLGGIGLGAALMYLLDPDRGARRRALARDRAVRFGRVAGERLGARSRDLRNRARGLAARARRTNPQETPADDVLEARVRSEIGRVVRTPGAIHAAARGGRVTLTGPVVTEEKEDLIAAVEAVPGVEDVEDRLEPHEGAGDVSPLQGSKAPRSQPDTGQGRFEPDNA